MKFRSCLISAVVAPVWMSVLLAGTHAQNRLPAVNVPSLTQNVQSADNYKVLQLEETVRQLNGKVEELNFILLQLQEKLRKMEEDNELRFQDIEDKLSALPRGKSLAENSGENRLGKPEASGNANPDVKSAETTRRIAPAKRVTPAKPERQALEPRALGTLTFDESGNVIDGQSNQKPEEMENPFGDASEGAIEASEFGATPNEVFTVAQRAYDARDYKRAQTAFAAHMTAWPNDPKTAQARYWLGLSLFWQKQYYEAAERHLDTHNSYPRAKTAPDNLLGLGLALAGLNQREVACATYAEVLRQYPSANARLGARVKDEQVATRC